MSRYPEQVHPAAAHFHDKQDVKPAQADGVEGEKVGDQQIGGLSAEKRSPADVCSPWCRPEACSGQDSADRPCSQAVSEPEEFALEAAVPKDGFSCARRSTSSRSSLLTGGRPGWFG